MSAGRRSLQAAQRAQMRPAPTNANPSAVVAPPTAQGPFYAYPHPGQPSPTPAPTSTNQPFVLFWFEKDLFWPIHNSISLDVFVAFEDTLVEPRLDMSLWWRGNRAIRRQMDFFFDSNNRTVPAQMINGKGYVVEEQGTGIQYPVHSLQILPTGHLQVIWPMRRRDELEIKSIGQQLLGTATNMAHECSKTEKIVVKRGLYRNLSLQNSLRAMRGLPDLVEEEESDPIIRQEMKVEECRKLAVKRRSHNHWILNSEKEEYKRQYKLEKEVLKQMKKEKMKKESKEKMMEQRKEKKKKAKKAQK